MMLCNYSSKFLDLMPLPIILYGASIDPPGHVCDSGSGANCYNYLESINMAKHVLFYVDRDTNKHDKQLCGKAILPPETLIKHPEAVIIITSGFIKQIFQTIKDMRCQNPIFTYDLFRDTPYEDDPFIKDYARLKESYMTSDIYTNKLLDALYESRTINCCLVHPVEEVIGWQSCHSYWYDRDTCLSRYPEITLLDAGAFTGDSIQQILQDNPGQIKKVYAIEPNFSSYTILKTQLSYMNNNTDFSLIAIQCALGSARAELAFSEDSDASRIDLHGKNKIMVMRLDDLDIQVEGKLCIKMDIEGFELPALQGGASLIKNNLPNLAICIYHRANDMYHIPEYIRSLSSDYKIVIRGGSHMVCYASVD